MKHIRLEYKIALALFLFAIVALAVLFAFTIFPAYSLVGDSSVSNAEATKKLDDMERLGGYLMYVVYGSLVLGVVTSGVGVFQDVRRKKPQE